MEGFLICGTGGGGREAGEYICSVSLVKPVQSAWQKLKQELWWVDVIDWEGGEDWKVVRTKRGHGMPVQNGGEVSRAKC